MIRNKFESLGFILADIYQKHCRQKRRPEILHIPGAVIRRPNMVTRRRRKEDAPNFTAEKWNEEYCKLYGATDRLTKAQIRKRTKTKELVAVAHSLRWEGEDQVTRMDQRSWTDTASVLELRAGEGRAGRPKIL